ncbi:rifin [Plasmodium reichenowi]|uniref:Rifin n=1 Tax=Plasmodium reichenowi TaxID=5854 RepID=A0A060RQ60_PLARE|nr:rifin [Plasmodium reichenowi]
MKLHYIKILLFVIPLNILLTSYHVHNKSKPSITRHHTQTNRSLCEGDTQSSNYDKDTGMKSVMQQFDDRTSQRFQEYEERVKEKRQKHKEQRDKNIQDIIERDKREKSLAEKVERGCLRCGCALGGGVLPVWGLVSGLWYATLSQHATKLAIEAGIKAGLKEGLPKVMEIANPSVSGVPGTIPTVEMLQPLTKGISGDNVTLYDILKCISTKVGDPVKATEHGPFYATVRTWAQKAPSDFNEEPLQSATAAFANAFKDAKAAEFASHTSLLSNTIIASVVAIVVIVLIMVIIYLVLRYRRKKKINKKAQYTKLLNQ